MTNKEFQERSRFLRNELSGIVSGLLLIDQGMPKRLKAYTVPRIAVTQPMPIVDVLKAIQDAIIESCTVAEAWQRMADPEEATDEQVDAKPVPIRKLDD